MSDEIMIVVAPVPGEKQDEKFPGAIDTAAEVIRCEEAGASIAHLHSRDEHLLQTPDPALFGRNATRIRGACPIIIEGSTGGAPEHTIDQRCAIFGVDEVEMGSLNLGSVNMYDGVYSNPYHEMRTYAQRLRASAILPVMPVFDLSHLINYRRLVEDGEIAAPFLFEFVFDVPAALPYSDRYLELFVDHLPEGAIWFCVRHHQRGAADLAKVSELGGHLRVGFEDSPFLSDGRRARDNAELVEDAVRQAEAAGRTVVRASRAREIIGLAAIP